MIRRALNRRAYRLETLSLMTRDWFGFRRPMLDNHTHLKETADWILRAQDATPDDGVSGGYSLEHGWIASYPETTGYTIPTLIAYSEYCHKPIYKERALAMARWELTCQLECGGFPGQFVDKRHPPVVFNTGQVIFGLLAAFLETREECFLESARRAGNWLIQVQDADGAFRRYDYRNAVHSYNARTAWALVELAKITETSRVLRAAEKHLDWVVSQQQPNGWFCMAGFDSRNDPFLHTIAYTIQGLLEAGLRLSRKDYITSAESASRALMPHLSAEGGMPATFDSEWRPTASYNCLTGNAQLAVIWFRMYEQTGEAVFRTSAQLLNRFLKSVHDCHTHRPAVRGALSGSYPISGRYLFGTYPNWAAKFFMDALLLEEARCNGASNYLNCW